MKPEVLWFARGGGIARSGPFKTQVEAAKALVLVSSGPLGAPRFPPDAFVWPEEVHPKKRAKK